MRIIVGAIGKLKNGPEGELVARYAERFSQTGRNLGLTGPDIVELPESRLGNAAQRKREEFFRLKEKLPDKAVIITFDERGKSLTSREFSAIIRKFADQGTVDLALLIGGPDGFDETVREEVDQVISFGKLTIPHQIVRILVMEQLYRAATILSNHPYHRD